MLKPNSSTMSAAKMAVSGLTPATRIRKGVNKIAAPVPAIVAIIAMSKPTGNKYHNSNMKPFLVVASFILLLFLFMSTCAGSS